MGQTRYAATPGYKKLKPLAAAAVTKVSSAIEVTSYEKGYCESQ